MAAEPPVPTAPGPFELLAEPPAHEPYALLELQLAWEGAEGFQERLAAALRVFAITRDPLDWIPNRGRAWATVNADGESLELLLYMLREELLARVDRAHGELVGALGELAAEVLARAAALEGVVLAGSYPELVLAGTVPPLLAPLGGADQPPAAGGNETPAAGARTPPALDAGRMRAIGVSAPAGGWEPIGLGAVQDLVQEAFGPVALDRSAVRLAPLPRAVPGCPACAGLSFGFPGELLDATKAMCPAHRGEARAIADQRISRTQRSNPAGWRALAKGSARVSGSAEPAGAPLPARRRAPAGRNDPCPCGSGRKYKHCCGR